MLTFLIISFIVGFIFLSIIYFISYLLSSNKDKGLQKNVTFQQNAQSLKTKTPTYGDPQFMINEPILKPTRKEKIPIKPYINNLVGFYVYEVKRQNDHTQFLSITMYVRNLTNGILNIIPSRVYYITENGEQIQGSVTRIFTNNITNENVMPHLKIKVPISIYEKIKEVRQNDVILLQLSVNGKSIALTNYIQNDGFSLE